MSNKIEIDFSIPVATRFTAGVVIIRDKNPNAELRSEHNCIYFGFADTFFSTGIRLSEDEKNKLIELGWHAEAGWWVFRNWA